MSCVSEVHRYPHGDRESSEPKDLQRMHPKLYPLFAALSEWGQCISKHAVNMSV